MLTVQAGYVGSSKKSGQRLAMLGVDHPEDKVSFVGKQAQHPMHMACNHTGWYAAAADKLLFQTVMAGAGLPVPQLLAITDAKRSSAGALIHRTVAKIATGSNPADNYWRSGNMLGAVNSGTGLITRVVRGTGAEMAVNEPHPDTKRPIVGTFMPNWSALKNLVVATARVLPGIRTQFWDVALTDAGPVLLEVNFGGDLNLAQLAYGTGVLDGNYTEHLRRCGYWS